MIRVPRGQPFLFTYQAVNASGAGVAGLAVFVSALVIPVSGSQLPSVRYRFETLKADPYYLPGMYYKKFTPEEVSSLFPAGDVMLVLQTEKFSGGAIVNEQFIQTYYIYEIQDDSTSEQIEMINSRLNQMEQTLYAVLSRVSE